MKNKRIVLLVSLLGTILFILLAVIQTNGFCYQNTFCNSLWSTINLIGNLLIFFIPTLFFSLITYFLKEEIFRIWVKFSYVLVSLSMFLVLIIPSGGGNGAFPSLIDPQMVAILMSSLFVIISLILVIFGVVKYYWLKK